MPNGWPFNLGEHGNEREGESLETRFVESLLVVYLLCALTVHDRCQKTVPVPIRGQ